MQQAISSERVQFVDLHVQTATLMSEFRAAIERVLDRCDFILGQDVAAFESEFAAYCGVHHAIGVDSGFSALEIALRAAGVGPGDEVITQANTFISTVGAMIAVGARPVLVDCAPDGSVDQEKMAAAITPQTKAVIPVHLFGRVARLEALLGVTESHGISLIEDACQAHGAHIDGKMAGSLGLASAFSFYPGKNLGAFGDGGMITTNSDEVAKLVTALRNHGQFVKYEHVVGPTLNRRLDTIQAAFLRVKLPHLDAWNAARVAIADRYRAALDGVPAQLPQPGRGGSHVYHLFVIETPRRDGLRAALESEGVSVGIHYPIPTHLQPALAFLGHSAGDFPNAERLARESLSLPMYPELPLEHVDRVAGIVRAFLES